MTDKAIDKYDTDLAVMLMNAGYEDAADYLLDGPKPESRQALTPQSSADMGKVRRALENCIKLMGQDGWSSYQLEDAKEALAILDQQAAPDWQKPLRKLVDIVWTYCYEDTSCPDHISISDRLIAMVPELCGLHPCFEKAKAHPIDLHTNAHIGNRTLTELKAAVEGMKSANKPWPNIENCECKACLGYNAALSAVAAKIDEMIRRG